MLFPAFPQTPGLQQRLRVGQVSVGKGPIRQHPLVQRNRLAQATIGRQFDGKIDETVAAYPLRFIQSHCRCRGLDRFLPPILGIQRRAQVLPRNGTLRVHRDGRAKMGFGCLQVARCPSCSCRSSTGCRSFAAGVRGRAGRQLRPRRVVPTQRGAWRDAVDPRFPATRFSGSACAGTRADPVRLPKTAEDGARSFRCSRRGPLPWASLQEWQAGQGRSPR